MAHPIILDVSVARVIIRYMITRIKATNYRCFRSLDFEPNSSLNIVVGDNETGKSTLLEVISLLIGGRVHGRWASDDLNPYWFNQEIVKAYFDDLVNGDAPSLPEIDLEVYFGKDTPGTMRLRGTHNSRGEDCPGLRMRVRPDPAHSDELTAYLSGSNLPQLVPTDLFIVDWRDFSGETVSRQPRGLGVALVNNSTATAYSGIDYKLRQLIRDFVSPQESAKIALEHRKAKAAITAGTLQAVNQRIAEEGDSFGVSLQMDQSAAANWDAVVAPHIEDTPFAMLGQGRQVATKIALAMSRSSDSSQFVLIEEPENHLSHTQLHRVIEQIDLLAGGRQSFITTHSSFVLNRLGLDSIHLMHKAKLIPFDTSVVSEDTITYFQKQSGYDTLRLAIASKVVVVEGPTDEMIFNLAYKKIKGIEPRANGIDVIALGTRGKRALELGKALDRKMAVLRDNDAKAPAHWEAQAAKFLESGKRQLFIGNPGLGSTLEPQVVNAGNESALRALLNLDPTEVLIDYMIANKTDWAWSVAKAEPNLTWPKYIQDAIEFIDAN